MTAQTKRHILNSHKRSPGKIPPNGRKGGPLETLRCGRTKNVAKIDILGAWGVTVNAISQFGGTYPQE